MPLKWLLQDGVYFDMFEYKQLLGVLTYDNRYVNEIGPTCYVLAH